MSGNEPTPHCADCSWANGEIYKHSRNCRWLSLESTLQRQAKEIADLVKMLENRQERMAMYRGALESLVYSIAGQVGTKTNAELPEWYRARLQDAEKVLIALSAKAGEGK